jgi:hypothetical protein
VVIDYVKLIQYGIFYNHARNAARSAALESDLAETWNRKHARAALGTSDIIPEMRTLFSNRKRELQQARTLLEMRVRAVYSALLRETDQTIEAEDREKAQRTAHRLIEYLPAEVWFLWLHYQHEDVGRAYIQRVASGVARVLRYTVIADYLALLLVELMVHMQHRETEEEAETGILYLLTQFSAPSVRGSISTRSHYLLSTGQYRFEALKADLEEIQAGVAGRKRTIEQFYRAVDAGDSNIGFYYTSFLKEACERVGASFESSARGGVAGGLLDLVLTI